MITPPAIIEARTTGRERVTMKKYAEACKDVARKANVPVIDLHTALVEAAGGDDEAHLDQYLP